MGLNLLSKKKEIAPLAPLPEASTPNYFIDFDRIPGKGWYGLTTWTDTDKNTHTLKTELVEGCLVTKLDGKLYMQHSATDAVLINVQPLHKKATYHYFSYHLTTQNVGSKKYLTLLKRGIIAYVVKS